jgi:hypothetical protein
MSKLEKLLTLALTNATVLSVGLDGSFAPIGRIRTSPTVWGTQEYDGSAQGNTGSGTVVTGQEEWLVQRLVANDERYAEQLNETTDSNTTTVTTSGFADMAVGGRTDDAAGHYGDGGTYGVVLFNTGTPNLVLLDEYLQDLMGL